ncbi:MAG TPA: adenylate/guanylate cyclase domain-containing protein [Candidatus Didemnitutus sp.]|nr:adenylate/guanylate cyclase domain-containing protein [Candidatus Didemnitutus sp.]
MSLNPDSKSPGGGGGSGHPSSLGPFIRAIQARDMEALAKFRHALRTPLNQIIGYCEMLMESAEEADIQEILRDLKRIHTAGGQLVALINDALAPWKVETGKIDVEAMRRDMRTPLNAIIGYAELCLDELNGSGKDELVSDLKKIHRAGVSLFRLFDSASFPEALQAGAPGDPGIAALATMGSADIAPLAPQGAAEIIAPSSGRPVARLLVVDDDEMNREMLARRLVKLGYDVTEAADGRIALQKLKEGNFDLILLDIVMPQLDGFQTLEFMKADPRLRHLPVIMITALDDVESTVRCIEAGAEDFVPKPFNPIILRARITASLDKKHLRDQEQAYLAQLQNERSKSERLLLNVLPRAVADRLKAGERTIVDSFLEATVVFADIVGFTRIAARNAPQKTVQLLNDLFSAFDRVAEMYSLEKIKTIGDSYMMVGGVPLAQPEHAEACASAAFEMLEALRVFNRRHQLEWQIRIGMNSGSVVAGIIGTKKFAYDLWGDTVNIAARMESQGQPGKVQVSAYVKELLDSKFDFEPVGRLEIKNIGPMETFLLGRRKGSAPPVTRPAARST